MLFKFDKRFAFFDPGIAFIELSEAHHAVNSHSLVCS